MGIYSCNATPLPLTGDESVEELVDAYPQTVKWLSHRHVVCIVCGEPYWGTLRELSEGKNIVGEEFEKLLADLNAFLQTDSNE